METELCDSLEGVSGPMQLPDVTTPPPNKPEGPDLGMILGILGGLLVLIVTAIVVTVCVRKKCTRRHFRQRTYNARNNPDAFQQQPLPHQQAPSEGKSRCGDKEEGEQMRATDTPSPKQEDC